MLRECLSLRQQSLPPGHWLIASAESILGECLMAERRYQEAEPLLLRGRASLEAARGSSGDPRVVQATRRLVALYEARGDAARAAEWRAKLPNQK
jgi:hypothetical protein